MITLTGKEIKDLAEAVGLMIQPLDYADELETEITIIDCPKEGVLDDDNKPTHYEHIAYLTDYPDEGSYPLGTELVPTPELRGDSGLIAGVPLESTVMQED